MHNDCFPDNFADCKARGRKTQAMPRLNQSRSVKENHPNASGGAHPSGRNVLRTLKIRQFAALPLMQVKPIKTGLVFQAAL